MPRKKRIKTKYTGVYYVFRNSKEKQKTEKIYYIRYRKKGRLIEEKVGQQNQSGMTPFKASLFVIRKLNKRNLKILVRENMTGSSNQTNILIGNLIKY